MGCRQRAESQIHLLRSQKKTKTPSSLDPNPIRLREGALKTDRQAAGSHPGSWQRLSNVGRRTEASRRSKGCLRGKSEPQNKQKKHNVGTNMERANNHFRKNGQWLRSIPRTRRGVSIQSRNRVDCS